MTFAAIAKTLGAPLPVQVAELCNQPAHEYTDFFKAISAQEQLLINACRQRATDACRKLQPLGTYSTKEPATLREIALANCATIRIRQQIYYYFSDLPGDMTTFRQKVHQFKDPELIRVAIPYKDRLECPYLRLDLLYFLERVAPDARETIAPIALSILQRPTKSKHTVHLFGILSGIPLNDRLLFLESLSQFVAYLPSEHWHEMGQILAKSHNKAESLRQTVSLFPEGMQQKPHEVKNALRAVSELQNLDAVASIRLLTNRCLDGSYICPIIRHVARLPQQERDDVVERVLQLMLDANAGILIYKTLMKLINLAIEQRDWITRHIEAVLSDYSRENVQEVLNLLDEIGPPPSLEQIRQHAIVIPDEEIDCYRMELSHDDLTDNPIQLLFNFVELIQSKKCHALKITFFDSPAVDNGGPSQEFISILVAEVCKKLKLTRRNENGLYRLYKEELTTEEKQIYEALGQLFMFLLNAKRKYVTGHLFDMSLFVALSELDNSLMPFDDDNFKALFQIYEEMCKEFDQKTVEHMKSASREECIAAMKGFMVPCMAIKRGMLDSPFAQQKIPAEKLFHSIQGSLSNSFVYSQIRFKPGIPAAKQEWFKAWILGIDTQKLRSFLYGLTGGFALGEKTLTVATSPDNIHFHTCDDSTLEVPFSHINSPELFASLIEGELTHFTTV